MVWVTILVIVLILVALLLPFILKAIINNALRKMDSYTGEVERLHVNLFKSQITFHRIAISKDTDPNHDEPLVLVPNVNICFKWQQLFRKVLDVKIVIDKPQLFFTSDPGLSEEGDANRAHEIPGFKKAIEKLFPFIISVDVREGQIHYKNSHSRAPLQIAATELNLTIQDFSNRFALSRSCSIAGKCNLYEGNVELTAVLLPLEPKLTVDSNLQLNSINLTLLNDVLREYGKVDISTGTLDLYAEVAIVNNSFKGYVKPFLKDLHFISTADQHDNIFQKVWEKMVAGFYNVLENNNNNQVATEIPFQGRLDDPNVRVAAAVIGIFRNAFVKALTPSFDNITNLKTIWNTGRLKTKERVQAIFK